jgi:hypothetical protein
MISAASLNKVSLSEISISRLMPLSHQQTQEVNKPLHMLLRTYKISYFLHFGVSIKAHCTHHTSLPLV